MSALTTMSDLEFNVQLSTPS